MLECEAFQAHVGPRPELDVREHQVAGFRIILVSFLTFLVPLASVGSGQTVSTTTGAINGTVTDTTGAVLRWVTVGISGDTLMGVHTAWTNAEGFYRFPALPPGWYTLVFTMEGFKPVKREAVSIGVGFTATVGVALDIATLQEQAIVESTTPVVDNQSTAVATTFDANQLARLPGARNMTAILAATPAVFVNRFDVGGSTAFTGVATSAYGTSGNNRPMIEGIDVTGIQGTGFSLDYGSFDAVYVTTAAHTAEWPKPGVQTQFLVKSGGNQYRGTLYADYENRGWQSFNIDWDQISRGAQGGGSLLPRETNRLWSYRDINADVGGYIKRDRVWWYSSFRDQDIGARYVNFPVKKPFRSRVTNYSGKGTYQITPDHKLVAYGQTGHNEQPNRLDPSGLTSGLNATTAINESEESTTRQLGWGWAWKGEWNAVIDDALFLEVRAGEFGANRSDRPNGSGPRNEDLVTLIVRGGNRDWQSNLRREQAFGSLSHFKDGWFGSHHLKVGGEVYRTTQADIWREAYPGNVLHVLQNAVPREVYLFQTPSMSEAGLWAYSAYANDSWRLNGHTTLNLGLRMDRFRLFLPEQSSPTAQTFAAIDNVVDWNTLAPRIGLARDLAGDGRTVLKFNYGQYWANPGVDTAFNANENSSQWWRRYTWSDPNANGVWDEGEQGSPRGNRGGEKLESLDPALELPFVREVGGWIEHELFTGIGVRSGIVWRGERQHFQRQNANQPFDAFAVPVEIPDPGRDGQVGTADDGSSIPGYQLKPEFAALPAVNVVRNVPNSDSHYWTWDITANKRFSRRWSLVAGFAHTWNHDQASGYLGQLTRQNTYPLTPNDLINAGTDGRYKFTTWSAKVLGTYEGPWGLWVTPFLRHQSGQPFGRTFSTTLNYGTVRILAEPIGTRRMDNVTILDMRIEKELRLAGNHHVAAFVDVFNLLNANPEPNINWSSGSFLQPLTIVAPRIARIGAKVEW